MQNDYCIQFERSGGFMGQIIAGEICSNSLPTVERQKLDSLLQQSNIYNYNPGDSVSPGFPDQFQYVIIIEKQENKKSLKFNDSTLPDQFRPLINYLMQTTRTKK